MRIARAISTTLATVAVAILLVGAGFVACVLPPVTTLLANTCVDDVTSPFNRSQLVSVADATRDYSFGRHDELALYRAVYEVDLELYQEVIAAEGVLSRGFPQVVVVTDPTDVNQLKAMCANASDMYVLSADAISHLDDCNVLARVAYVSLGVLTALMLAVLWFCHAHGYMRAVGFVLLSAGLSILGIFTVFGVFAAIDFNGFFTLFHGVLFSQGNWQFSYDSLLICSLPTSFWIGMGAVWLFVSAACSVACIVMGRRLR